MVREAREKQGRSKDLLQVEYVFTVKPSTITMFSYQRLDHLLEMTPSGMHTFVWHLKIITPEITKTKPDVYSQT